MAAPSVVSVIAKTAFVGGSATLVFTLTTAVAADEQIVLCFAGGGAFLTAVDSDGVNIYSALHQLGGNSPNPSLAWSPGGSALSIGATITCSMNNAASNKFGAIAFKISGAGGVSASNGLGGDSIVGTTAALSSAWTPGAAMSVRDALMVCLLGTNTANEAEVLSITDGYTILDKQASGVGGSSYTLAIATKQVTAPVGAQNPVWTVSTSRTMCILDVDLGAVGALGSRGRDVVPDRAASSHRAALGTNSDLTYGVKGRSTTDGWPQPVVPVVTRRPVRREPDYTTVSG